MKKTMRILLFFAVLTAFLCATAYAADVDYALVERIWLDSKDGRHVISSILSANGEITNSGEESTSISAPRARLRLTSGSCRTVTLNESAAYRDDKEGLVQETFRAGKIVRYSAVSGVYKLYAVNPASQIRYDGASVSRHAMNNGANVKCAVLDNALYGFQRNGEIVAADANTTFIVNDVASGSCKTYVGIDNTPDIYGVSPDEEPVGYAYCEENVAKIVYFTYCDIKRPDVKIRIPYAPLVNSRAIMAKDLDGLEEIAVPVQSSFDNPVEITLFALFYERNGKYLGMGTITATINNQTSFVIMLVQNNVTGAETLKMLVTDADFRPLSDGASYSLTGGGGGGGSSGGGLSHTCYLQAIADTLYENGGSGDAYLTETEPTEDMELSQAHSFSAVLQHEGVASYAFAYYVIFAPDEGAALAYPRIVQGLSVTSVARVNVTLKSAPSAVIYRIIAWSDAKSVNDAPLVTMKGIIRGDSSGGAV